MAASPTKLVANYGTTDEVVVRCMLMHFGAFKFLDAMIQMLQEDIDSGRFMQEPMDRWMAALKLARNQGEE